MDLVAAFQRSLADFTTRVGRVQPSQWDAPTPCTEWDVRTLVNHGVREARWIPPLFSGATIAEVGDRFDGDLLGTDPAATAISAAGEADSVVSRPGALNRTVNLSFGETPAREYVHQLTADLLIHSWDLAVAIGDDPVLDPQVVEMVADWFGDEEQMYRDTGVIGPPVPVSADAGQQDRLLGAFGRNPDWAPGRLPSA